VKGPEAEEGIENREQGRGKEMTCGPGLSMPGERFRFQRERPFKFVVVYCSSLIGSQKARSGTFCSLAPRKVKSVVFPFLTDKGLTTRVHDPGAPLGAR